MAADPMAAFAALDTPAAIIDAARMQANIARMQARMDALGVRTLIHTDISTDGMLTGPNFAAQEAMLAAVNCRVIASGGVSRREDVVQLVEMQKRRPNLDGVIIGKALYEGRVELGDLLALAKA